jgi:hypothetical protein
MKTIKIISISEHNSGREYDTAPLSTYDYRTLSKLLLTSEEEQEPQYQASLYELTRSDWLNRHKSSTWNNAHGSHYCSEKAVKELCLGDYI